MYVQCTDESVWLKFYEAEKTMPRWYTDGVESFRTSKDEFLSFCRKCWRIYLINDIGLLYVQRTKDIASIHFSMVRGSRIPVDDFHAIRDEMFGDVDVIMGWVCEKNRSLRKVVEGVGFVNKGLQMLFGTSHGRVLKWDCYTVASHGVIKGKNLLES